MDQMHESYNHVMCMAGGMVVGLCIRFHCALLPVPGESDPGLLPVPARYKLLVLGAPSVEGLSATEMCHSPPPPPEAGRCSCCDLPAQQYVKPLGVGDHSHPNLSAPGVPHIPRIKRLQLCSVAPRPQLGPDTGMHVLQLWDSGSLCCWDRELAAAGPETALRCRTPSPGRAWCISATRCPVD